MESLFFNNYQTGPNYFYLQDSRLSYYLRKISGQPFKPPNFDKFNIFCVYILYELIHI